MTGPGMMKVEYEELIARAAELERPIVDGNGRGIPTEVPQAPCAVQEIQQAIAILRLSTENVQGCLKDFVRERQALAQSLRNAAKAYRAADEEAAYALQNETALSGAVLPDAVTTGSGARAMLGDRPDPTKDEIIAGLHSVEKTALEITRPDQGASLDRYVDQWTQYLAALRQVRNQFRRFEAWEGTAVSTVMDNFKQQQRWLDATVTLIGAMNGQAKTMVNEFRTLRDLHVWGTDLQDRKRKKLGYDQIVALEQFYKRLPDIFSLKAIIDWYRELTDESARLLNEFMAKSGVKSMTELRPEDPPTAAKIKPPNPWKPVPRPSDEDIHKAHIIKPAKRPTDEEIWDHRIIKPTPRPWIEGDDDVPVIPDAGGGGHPSGPTMPMMPSMPSMPSTPQANDSQLADALKDLKGQGPPHVPHTGGGVKPASFGGGGVPGTPLGTWADDGAAARAASAGPGNLGRGVPGVGAAPGGTGGGMGGGMPQGGDKGAGKGKRVQGEDEEAMYTEDRAWTEGVIGLRGAKEVPKQ